LAAGCIILGLSGRRWRDGGTFEDEDRVSVPAQDAVDGDGDMEAHGKLKLGALPTTLEHPGGALGKLECVHSTAALLARRAGGHERGEGGGEGGDDGDEEVVTERVVRRE
jgi:hypothetical protein